MKNNLKNIRIAVKNINDFLNHAASRPAHIVFEKGNQTTGISHKVFLYHGKHETDELFRSPTLAGILDRLIGFDYGLRQFRLFQQR